MSRVEEIIFWLKRYQELERAAKAAIEDQYVEELHNVHEQCCGLCDLRNALEALRGAGGKK